MVQFGVEDAVYKVQCTHALLSVVRICSQGIHHVLLKGLCGCYGITVMLSSTQPLSNWSYELQIAHHKLVENKLMIHRKIHATVPYVVKSDLDVFGSVEGVGVGWSFLKMHQFGSSLQAVPWRMLPHYWSCAHQVQ